jgi:hypothetical protein
MLLWASCGEGRPLPPPHTHTARGCVGLCRATAALVRSDCMQLIPTHNSWAGAFHAITHIYLWKGKKTHCGDDSGQNAQHQH